MPQFHIHNTVEIPIGGPPYEDICKLVDAKPLVINNVMWGSTSYVEHIPSIKFDGEVYMAAYESGCLQGKLHQLGCKTIRAKVEGPPHLPYLAHYYEAHVKFPWTDANYIRFLEAKLPVSWVSGKTELIVTVRAYQLSDVKERIRSLKLDYDPKIEACYFDTNVALDTKWINQ